MMLSKTRLALIVVAALLIIFQQPALGQVAPQGEPGCTTDDDCDDGLFCTGAESCVDGSCVALSACPPGVNGCVMVGAICDEENDTCLDEPDDSLCDNGLFCDGAEFCDPKSGECLPGLTCPAAIDGCKIFGACDEDQDECISELDDELCDEGEFCDAGGQCQVVAFRAFLPVAPASVEPDIPFTRVHVVNVGDESTPVAFSIIDGTGEVLDRASTDIAANGSATYAASVPGQQTQSLNSPIIPASALVTSDLPLAVIAEVTLRVGDATFPPFGAVPVDACVGWSYVHSESDEQRSGIALHNSDPDSAASCNLSFFEGLEGVPIGRIQRDIPAGHRIQFFPGDEVPASSNGGGLPEGTSAAFIQCDVPVYAAVLNQAPGGAIILNEATCLDFLVQ